MSTDKLFCKTGEVEIYNCEDGSCHSDTGITNNNIIFFPLFFKF